MKTVTHAGSAGRIMFTLGKMKLINRKIPPTKVAGIPARISLSFFIISCTLIDFIKKIKYNM